MKYGHGIEELIIYNNMMLVMGRLSGVSRINICCLMTQLVCMRQKITYGMHKCYSSVMSGVNCRLKVTQKNLLLNYSGIVNFMTRSAADTNYSTTKNKDQHLTNA